MAQVRTQIFANGPLKLNSKISPGFASENDPGENRHHRFFKSLPSWKKPAFSKHNNNNKQ